MKKLFSITLFLFVAWCAAGQTLPSYVPTAGLAGWWPFSGNANDNSGGNHHGIVNGAVLTTDRNGVPNAAYEFNGLNNSIYVPPTGVTNISNFTFSCWLLYTGDAGGLTYDTYAMFGDRDTWGYGHTFGLAYDFANAKFNQYLRCQTTITTPFNMKNSWHHVVNVSSGFVRKLYVDGVMIDSTTEANMLCYQGSNTLWFGACAVDNQFVTGKMDDIGFWDRALTEEEITGLYHAEPIDPGPTAVSNTSAARKLAVYPNPAINTLYIHTDILLKNAPYRLSDPLGKIIATGSLDSNYEVDIHLLAPGMYYLAVIADGDQRTIPFVKH